MRVVFAVSAGADIRRVAGFLARKNEALALEAVACIQEASLKLVHFPERGVPLNGSDVRRLAVFFGRTAYLIDYRVDLRRETVTILRVRHSREAR